MSGVDGPTFARLLRSGVVVALPLPADLSHIYNLCATFAIHAEQFAPGERDVIAVFDFASTLGETALAVSHIGADAIESRPDIAVVLGYPVVDAVRIDSYTTPDAPENALRAEILLLRIARDIARLYGGLVCDDLGAIYDPTELEDRVARGLPRETTFAFAVAASMLIDTIRDRPIAAHIALPDLNGERAPSECAPDLALAGASIFIVMGPHVPLITATRIAFVASAAPSIPVVVFAPNLLEGDASVLRSAGVAVARSANELTTTLGDADSTSLQRIVPATPYARDEVVFFATTNLGCEAVNAFIAHRLLEIAELAGRGFVDQPIVVSEDSELGHGSAPARLARFAFSGTVLDLYHLDVSRAHPLLVALIGARGELHDLYDRNIANAIVCEFLASGETPSEVADAFAMSLLAELAAREPSITQDDSGAVFDAVQLAGLSARRCGRVESWTERIAIASLSVGA
jgi:hypothetical protein